MVKIIKISEPTIYYSCKDEESFFNWLESIKAIRKVEGTKVGLSVTLNDVVDDVSLRELIGLLKRYSIDMNCLKILLTDKNRDWFKSRKAYWYSSVFGK